MRDPSAHAKSRAVDMLKLTEEWDWQDAIKADDADYMLRFLDSSYSSWIPRLYEITMNTNLDYDFRRWAAEAVDRIEPRGPTIKEILAKFRNEKYWALRSLRFWLKWRRFWGTP